MTGQREPGTVPTLTPGGGSVTAAAVFDSLCGGWAGLGGAGLVAERMAEISPLLVAGLRAGRAFVNRAVAEAARAGVVQFVQVGCGYPTGRSVHDVAGRTRRGVRTVYADDDAAPVGVIDMLTMGDSAVISMVRGVRDPEGLLAHERVNAILDRSQPICVVMGATLAHLDAQDDPAAVVARWRSRLVAGSWLVMCHPTAGEPGREAVAAHEAARLFHSVTGTRLVLRTQEEIARLPSGLEVRPPGLAPVNAWRPPLLRGQPVPMLGVVATVPRDSGETGR